MRLTTTKARDQAVPYERLVLGTVLLNDAGFPQTAPLQPEDFTLSAARFFAGCASFTNRDAVLTSSLLADVRDFQWVHQQRRRAAFGGHDRLSRTGHGSRGGLAVSKETDELGTLEVAMMGGPPHA